MKRRCLGGGCLILPMLAWGWGAGHDTVARALAERLPEPWHGRLQGAALTQFCEDNHYPDAGKKLAENARITADEQACLGRYKMTACYGFHSDEGRGVAFCLLVRALRENRPDGALLWLACLAHSTADMAACNHDPIVHLPTYAWSDPGWNMLLPGGAAVGAMPLDLGWVERRPDTEAVWKARVARAAAVDSGKGADDTVLDVMLDGLRGVEVCAPLGVPIVRQSAAWTAGQKAEDALALAGSLSALGAWAVERVICDFLAAERLARQGARPEVTDAVRERYRAAWTTFTSSRVYGEDSFTRGLTVPLKPDVPCLGVVSEPTWRMNDGLFGFNDRVLAAQTVSSLRRKGMNAALVDVRSVMGTEISVAAMPALVVFAQRVGAYYSLAPKVLTARLASYRRAGGKIVWIGGDLPERSLCDFPEKAASRADVEKTGSYRWCWTRLPVGTNAYSTLTLTVGNHEARRLSHTPSFQVGWQAPSSTTVFEPEALSFVSPLAYLRDGSRSLLIGGAWPKAAPEVAYLPTYAVFPYLWTQESPSLVPFELGLDSQGMDALETALAALRLDARLK